MTNGQARVQNIGQDASTGNTVIYCVGTSAEIADAKFSMRITSGEYAFYSTDVAKRLKGKSVLFDYLSTSDMRVPRSITFKAVLE